MRSPPTCSARRSPRGGGRELPRPRARVVVPVLLPRAERGLSRAQPPLVAGAAPAAHAHAPGGLAAGPSRPGAAGDDHHLRPRLRRHHRRADSRRIPALLPGARDRGGERRLARRHAGSAHEDLRARVVSRGVLAPDPGAARAHDLSLARAAQPAGDRQGARRHGGRVERGPQCLALPARVRVEHALDPARATACASSWSPSSTIREPSRRPPPRA